TSGWPIGHGELQAYSEMRGMAAGAPPQFLNAAAFAQGMVERRAQGIGDESQRIQEIAFAGPVRAHQKRKGMQIHVAGFDALVILEHHSRQEGGVRHLPPAAARAWSRAFKTAPVDAANGSSPETTRSACFMVGQTNHSALGSTVRRYC